MSFEMYPETRVMLVDDHVLVRASLVHLLHSTAQFEVTYEASHGRDAISAVGERRPDLILLDISMPEMDGLTALPELIVASPRSRIVMLTAHSEAETVRTALSCGASGYVTKQSGADSLLQAMNSALRGEVYVSPGCAQFTPAEAPARSEPEADLALSSRDNSLTLRQREVLTLIADGATSKQVATRLGISVKTVESHRTAMMRSLDIHNLAGLVRYAVRVGLVSPTARLNRA